METEDILWPIIIALMLFPLAAIPSARAAPRENAKKPPELKLASIDINQASEEDFTKLPGVGPELAKRIVAYRTKHGRFHRAEDLLVIRGIGRKKWKAIQPYIRINTQHTGRELAAGNWVA